MMMRMLPMIGFAALIVAPAQADEPAKPADGDQIVCKYQARTATRFKKKICHTRAVWEEMSENAKRQAQQDFNKPAISIEKGS